MAPPRIYAHRELPPIDEEIAGEQVVEAASDPIPYVWTERDALWQRCHDSLMRRAHERIEQEVIRLGGSSAHLLEEIIEPKIDHATEQYQLVGRFAFVMYRTPGASSVPGTNRPA